MGYINRKPQPKVITTEYDLKPIMEKLLLRFNPLFLDAEDYTLKPPYEFMFHKKFEILFPFKRGKNKAEDKKLRDRFFDMFNPLVNKIDLGEITIRIHGYNDRFVDDKILVLFDYYQIINHDYIPKEIEPLELEDKEIIKPIKKKKKEVKNG